MPIEPIKGCQLDGLPRMAEGLETGDRLSFKNWIKRSLAKPWNYVIKKWLKRISAALFGKPSPPASAVEKAPAVPLAVGDWVRVRSREEIESTLDRWHELRGCAFLENMWQYCGTTQRVLTPLQRFLDERDYKVKKCRGIVLLENIHCEGTPVFGRCDRRCYLFWREEWLEKISE